MFFVWEKHGSKDCAAREFQGCRCLLSLFDRDGGPHKNSFVGNRRTCNVVEKWYDDFWVSHTREKNVDMRKRERFLAEIRGGIGIYSPPPTHSHFLYELFISFFARFGAIFIRIRTDKTAGVQRRKPLLPNQKKPGTGFNWVSVPTVLFNRKGEKIISKFNLRQKVSCSPAQRLFSWCLCFVKWREGSILYNSTPLCSHTHSHIPTFSRHIPPLFWEPVKKRGGSLLGSKSSQPICSSSPHAFPKHYEGKERREIKNF